ncbi:MAG: hypothetical protein ACN6I5_00975 [Hyphomicrobiales bacterium]
MTKRDRAGHWRWPSWRRYRGALLWDVGAGCGSIGIEWMRDGAAKRVRSASNRKAERTCLMAAQNALTLGTPQARDWSTARRRLRLKRWIARAGCGVRRRRRVAAD